MTDLERLHTHLEQSGYKLQHVAQVVGISTNTLRMKLQGASEFKVGEAERLSRLLGLSTTERELCFFGAEGLRRPH